MQQRVKPSLGCGYALAGFVLLAGLALVVFGEQPGLRVLGGGVMIAGCVYAAFAKRLVAGSQEEERLRVEFANQPWKWRKEWRGPAIHSDDHKGMWGLVVFALIWNAMTLPIAWMVFSKPQPDNAVFLVTIFPAVGLLFLIAAGYKLAQRRKFGRTRFVPTSIPGVVGGYLGGMIEVPARVTPEADVRLALKCIRLVTTGAGKQRRVVETVLWEREECIAAEKLQASANRTDIPVLFYIPSGQPAADLDNLANQIVWRLSASAAVPGVDFKTTFSVPVFVTGDIAPPPPEGEPLLDVYRKG